MIYGGVVGEVWRSCGGAVEEFLEEVCGNCRGVVEEVCYGAGVE